MSISRINFASKMLRRSDIHDASGKALTWASSFQHEKQKWIVAATVSPPSDAEATRRGEMNASSPRNVPNPIQGEITESLKTLKIYV